MSRVKKAIEAAVNVKANGVEPQEFYNKLKSDVKSGDSRAISTLSDLVNLIVITYNESTLLRPGMDDFIQQFIDTPRDDNGNGRRYIKHFIQPGKDYDATKFIPTTTDDAKFKVQFIKFKNDDGTLATGSVQKLFDIVYIEANLITYFVNGQLDVFIQEEILEKIEDSLKVYLYDYVMKLLVNTSNIGKEINGTAANLFDAFTSEILPECVKMTLNSDKYNVSRQLPEAIDASRKEDLVMLMSSKTKTMLNSNIMSQLFNSAKLDIMDYVGQIHIPNNQFKFNEQVVKVEESQYIPENKIIVFDRKNYVRILTMLQTTGAQDYPLNLAKLKVLHLWLASGKLEWGKVFTYTNNNLNTSPSA